MVQLLLDRGADPNVDLEWNGMPITLGRKDVAEILKGLSRKQGESRMVERERIWTLLETTDHN